MPDLPTETDLHETSAKPDPGSCYHCGEPCEDTTIQLEDGKSFCCQGCKMVFEILQENNLCRYYELEDQPGTSLRGRTLEKYAYLDEPDLVEKLIDFTDSKQTKVRFYLPQIHCSSCIWLLENLYKLAPGILQSKVFFLQKEITILYDQEGMSLRKVVELLASIGYAPLIRMSSLDDSERPVVSKKLFYQLGVAGFAFGNIMLLSFPEYLGLENATWQRFFGYLNIALALPVLLYSGSDYLQSAWQGLKQRQLNIDVPISIGMLTLFFRSAFEIISHTGAGYLDSLAGLVFFLLIGKWFQQKTYHTLSFERDYKSYFPVAVTVKKNGTETPVSLNKLEVGNRIVVKNQELIPADSLLIKGQALIDYSFVTGEAEPVPVEMGEKVFAGGRQTGEGIELDVVKAVSQSYLTQLWNEQTFREEAPSRVTRLADRVGKYFTWVILAVASGTLIYWVPQDMSIAVNAFTAVLIIACPCAIALSIPFTFGNVLRILGRNQFYLKNIRVVEAMQQVHDIVFDKTGTITNANAQQMQFEGECLSPAEKQWIKSLASHSTHPLSRAITQSFNGISALKVEDWKEVSGKGVQGNVSGKEIRIGSHYFMEGCKNAPAGHVGGGNVFVAIDNEVRGHFSSINQYRPALRSVFKDLQCRFKLWLLSGDNETDKAHLAPMFQDAGALYFNQSPANKLHFIKDLQNQEKQVMMVGDGLNDAGALQQSDLGVVITEDINNFTPASDAIMASEQFEQLPLFLQYARSSRRVVYASYLLALIYNVIGLTFAVQGELSPIIAAILMPLSSITIVIFGVGLSSLVAVRLGLLRNDGKEAAK